MGGYSTVTGARRALQYLDWQESVLSYGSSTPPVAPSNGDRYLIWPAGAGAWLGYDNYIAEYKGSPLGTWQFTAPDLGSATYVEDENIVYIYIGGITWVPISVSLGFKSGTATITAGNTTVAVTHGSFWTPGDDDVRVTPLDNLNGRSFWVDTIGALTFNINMDVADIGDHEFNWQLVV